MPEQEDQPSKFKIWSIRILGIIALGFISLLVLNFEDLFLQKPMQRSSIGIVQMKDGNVRIKRPGDSNWHNLQKGDFIHSRSLVFTSQNSRVRYVLIDGTIIDQDPETLLKLHFNIKKNRNPQNPTKTLESVDIKLTKGSVNITTSPSDSAVAEKNLNLNKNTFKVKGDNSLVKVNRQEDTKDYSLAVVRGKVGFVSNSNEEIELSKGEQLSNLNEKTAVSTEAPPKKEKVPDALLEKYEQEAQSKIDEEMQKEFIEARSLSRILQRILNGIL